MSKRGATVHLPTTSGSHQVSSRKLGHDTSTSTVVNVNSLAPERSGLWIALTWHRYSGMVVSTPVTPVPAWPQPHRPSSTN
jgi:hypothetical protein